VWRIPRCPLQGCKIILSDTDAILVGMRYKLDSGDSSCQLGEGAGDAKMLSTLA